jgi:hypothetical protein
VPSTATTRPLAAADEPIRNRRAKSSRSFIRQPARRTDREFVTAVNRELAAAHQSWWRTRCQSAIGNRRALLPSCLRLPEHSSASDATSYDEQRHTGKPTPLLAR